MAKHPTDPPILENLLRISTKNLRELNFLNGKYDSAAISFKDQHQKECRISLTISTQDGNSYAQFEHEVRSKSYKQTIPLIKVQSNLGKGFIWYFHYPATNKRFRVLYFYTNEFLHKDEIPERAFYESQTLPKKHRPIDSLSKKIGKVEQLSKEMKKPYSKVRYNGTFTKRMNRLIDLNIGISF